MANKFYFFYGGYDLFLASTVNTSRNGYTWARKTNKNLFTL